MVLAGWIVAITVLLLTRKRKPEPDWKAIAYRQHLMALVHGAKQCDTESCTQWLREFEEANRG